MIFNKLAILGKVKKVNISSSKNNLTIIKFIVGVMGSGAPFDMELTVFKKEGFEGNFGSVKEGSMVIADCTIKYSKYTKNIYVMANSVQAIDEFIEGQDINNNQEEDLI